MTIKKEEILKPGPSRYRLSVNKRIVMINSKGERVYPGSIQSVNVSQSKDAERNYEMNSEGQCYEVTQGLVREITIQVEKLKLNTGTLLSEFTGIAGIEDLFSAAIPFDIEEYMLIPKVNDDGSISPFKKDATEKLIKTYLGCVIKNYSDNSSITGNIVETESATIEAREIK